MWPRATAIAPLRTFFELTPLRALDFVLIGAAVMVGALVLRLVWRRNLFERLLDLDGSWHIRDM